MEFHYSFIWMLYYYQLKGWLSSVSLIHPKGWYTYLAHLASRMRTSIGYLKSVILALFRKVLVILITKQNKA